MDNIKKLEHPVVKNFVYKLRDKNTPSNIFRRTVSSLAKILLVEALKDENLFVYPVETPLEKAEYPKLKEEEFVIVAIMRAGLPMLEGCLEILPDAKSGFLGIKRNEQTLQSTVYYNRVPDLKNKKVIIVDPMVATGGSLSLALEYILSQEPATVKSLHILASPEGLKSVQKHPVQFFVAEIDRGLNDRGYIVPGIGDAGDRAFNTDE